MTYNFYKKKAGLIVIFIVFTIVSCKNESVEKAAKDYCNCMDRNLTKSSEVVALTICEAELVNRFYYYRISRINLPMEKNTSFQLSWEEAEKARLFICKLDSLVYVRCNRDIR